MSDNHSRPSQQILILIGPMYAGKSTVARLVAERLGIPRVCMDHVRFDYYKEIGYDEQHAKELEKSGGFGALCAYWKPFEAHAVERLLADHAHERCVIDFGAGHSVYEDEELLQRVGLAVRTHKVILLLPSPDEEESLRILTERRDVKHPQMAGQPSTVNEHFLRHPSNRMLANMVVYTREHSPDQTADEVIRLIQPSTR